MKPVAVHPLNRRLVGVPVWLLLGVAVPLLIAHALIPAPQWNQRVARAQLAILQHADGSIDIVDFWNLIRSEGLPEGATLVALATHEVRSIANSDRYPTAHYDQHTTRATSPPRPDVWCPVGPDVWCPVGEEPPVDRTDEFWPYIRSHLADAAPKFGDVVTANGVSDRQVWLPGMVYRVRRVVAGVMWIVVIASAIRLCIPLPQTQRTRRLAAGLCEKCAYPIGVSPVCTECGAAVGGARKANA